MAALAFEREHALGLEEARAVADRLALEMSEQYGVESHWDGNVLHFARTGLSGVLRLDSKHVRLEAQLGFLFSAFKPRIEAAMSANFERYFGA